jgi:flagellar protein FliJ
MKKSKRIEPIQEIASSRANELGQAVAHAAAQLSETEQQLKQLQGYRDDYMQKSGDPSASMDPVRLQNYRAFLDRLGEAIRQQELAVGAAKSDYELRRQEWSELKVEAEALGRAVDRYKAEERRSQDRLEQNESDDTASQRAFASRTGGPH